MHYSKQHPPKLADRLLKWYCADEYFEEVQGDLHEWFYQRVDEVGLKKARRQYYLDVVRYFRAFRLKNKYRFSNNSKFLYMKTLFKLTFRNLRRDGLSAFLRIGNLSLGIVIFLLTLVYARYEISYDTYHDDHERIYRLGHSLRGNPWAAGPIGLGAYLQTDMPEIEVSTRVMPVQETWLKRGDKIFNERNGQFVDERFFEVFRHKAIDGVLSEALKDIRSVVLTQSMATKYFGTENPVGQIVEFGAERGKTRVVTAVIADVPEQSHLQFDFLVPIMTFGERFTTRWRNWATYTYAKLYPDTNLNDFTAKVKQGYMDNYPNNDPGMLDVFVTPVSDIHLRTNHEKELADNGNISYVYVLLSVGLFVLLISSINFVNLSVIKGLDRGKEVGLRKTIGATKGQVIMQFLGENFIVICLAALLSLVALTILAPVFQGFAELSLPLNAFYNTDILWPVAILIVILELVCGAYPAVVLSRFKPASILKIGGKGGLRNRRLGFLRKGLIVLQFGISLILIVSSFLIYDQVNYIQNRDMGFEKDQVLTIALENEMQANFRSFRDQLNAISGVRAVSISSDVPGYRISIEPLEELDAARPDDFRAPEIRGIMADDQFVSVYGLELLEGRDFRKDLPRGITEYLLNEAAVKSMFEGRDPLARRVVYRGDTGRIVGIVRDFNYKTIHSEVEPLIIGSSLRNGIASVRFDPQRTDEVLEGIDQIGNTLFAGLPTIESRFLSDRFAQLYKAETKLKSLVWMFCLISIVLTMSGIFGVATYVARQKTREIAIRKVLGSGVSALFRLMSKSFVVLLIFSVLIALPVAYYLSGWWLQNFAYQVPVNATGFILAVLGVFLLVLLGSGVVTLKAVRANPTEALKSD